MCKKPLKGFQIGFTDSGKPDYMITSYDVHHIEKKYGKWSKEYDSFVSPFAEKVVRDFTEIPCGHCTECRLKHSRMWADRCLMEMSYYEPCECWFLTLTYDEEHLCDVGSDIFAGTLVKEDLQKFCKRVRQYIERKCGEKSRFRYFACGEYGTKTLRPHYHMIVYGLSQIDLESWSKSKTGFPLFRSKTLENIWNKGIVTVSPVSWDTCAYTARYVLKKAYWNNKIYEKNNVIPEFVVMSRRPGIGRQFYEDNKESIKEFDEIILKTDSGGKIVRPPRYFDSIFEAEDPDEYKKTKERRLEKAQCNVMHKLSHTDKSYLEMLQDEETVLVNRIKALKRSKI